MVDLNDPFDSSAVSLSSAVGTYSSITGASAASSCASWYGRLFFIITNFVF
jgi:hypothetical protein